MLKNELNVDIKYYVGIGFYCILVLISLCRFDMFEF